MLPQMVPPQSIDHRCLGYHYTKQIYRSSSDGPPSQSSIDALTTTTPNKKYTVPHKSIDRRALAYHYTAYHIYIYIAPPQSIEHTCLEYHYSKYIGPPQSIEHRGLAYCYTAYIYRSSPVK